METKKKRKIFKRISTVLAVVVLLGYILHDEIQDTKAQALSEEYLTIPLS